MKQTLLEIFELEENKQFEKAYTAYLNLYSKECTDYDTWKHFYFFLWISTEDASERFVVENKIGEQLINLLNDGISSFAHLADFNFIVGYTISIWPPEFGDPNECQQKAISMRNKATQMEPNNSIYKLSYLGVVANINDPIYQSAEINAAQEVLDTFSGKGFLNKYFRLVLYRGQKAYR